MRLFYNHDTTEYSLLWDKTQSDYKDQELKAVAWSNLYCKGISAEREISQNYTRIFLNFVHGFGSYVKGLPKNKRMQFGGRYGFGVYVKWPLGLETPKGVL